MDKAFKLILRACVAITVITTVTVIFLLTKESLVFFKQVSVFDFLFGTEWHPLLVPQSFGVLPLVFGTMTIVIGAVMLALPCGLMIAVYLSEYASDKGRKILKPSLEILAGIPTIVYGYFALTFITPLIKSIHPETEVFNGLSGAIVVAIMVLPMVSSLCDDAFRSVPANLKQGAFALGANTFEVVKDVLLPASKGRIGAAVILAVSRAIGETMAVTLAAGATPKMGIKFFESIQTMTAYIVQVSLGDTPQGGIEYQSSFAVGALLFLMTLTMNFIGNTLIFKRNKVQL